MLSIGIQWAAPVLTLTGNGGADSVSVVGRASYVDVFVNNNFQARIQTANSGNVSEIRFTDSGGNDALSIQGIQPAGGTLSVGTAANKLSGLETLSVVNGKNTVNVNSANALNLGTSKFTGTLSVTTAGALTQTGAVSVTGLTTLVATAGNITLANAANDFSRVDFDANAAAGQNVSITDVNGIAFAASEATGNLTVRANQNSTNRVAISQTGRVAIGGSTALTVGSASTVKLDNAGNDLHGPAGSVSVTAGAHATLRDAAAVNLGTSTLTGNLTVIAGGPITQSGNVVVKKTATFTTAPASAITLDSSDNNDFGTLAATGSAVSVKDVNALVLGGISAAALNVTTDGAVTQKAAIAVTGTATLDAGSVNDITLSKSTNDFNVVRIVSGDDVNLRDKNAIQLSDGGASTVSGNLTVTAGAISQGAGELLVTAGKTTLKGAAITLTDSDNNFNELAVASGTTVQLRDTDSLILGASKISAALTVEVNGELTQSGALAVKSNTTTLIAGAANDIALDNSGNDFKTVSVTSANNVSLRDANAIVLGDSTVSGNLEVKANLNSSNRLAISQSGPVNVTGSTALEVGSRSTIKLDNAANDFDLDGSGDDVAVIAGANATLVDANTIVLGASTLTGNLSVTSGGNAGDDITQSGPLVVAKVTTLSAGAADIVLGDDDNDFGTLGIIDGAAVSVNDANALTLGASTCDTLNVTTDGAITQSGALTLTTSVSLSAGAANDIVLSNALNDLISIGIDSARNVTLRDAGAADLELASSTITGTLSVTTTTGGIAEALGATLDVGGKTTLTVPTVSDITLDELTNNLGEVAVTSANNVTLTNGDALTLAASTVSGNLTVTLDAAASGGLTQSGTLRVTGNTILETGDNDVELINAANNFAAVVVTDAENVKLRDINAIQLGVAGTGGVNVDANFEVTAGGAITDGDALVIGGLTTLTTSVLADITLDTGTNAFADAVSVVSANNVAISVADGLMMGASTVSGTLVLTLGPAGDLTQSGPLVVAGTTTVTANDVDLSNAANDFSTVNVTTGAAGDASIADADDVVLGTVVVAGDLRVKANGSITDSGVVAVALTTTLEADADGDSTGDVTLNSASSFAGSISVQGGVNVEIANSVATILGDMYATGNLTITGGADLTNDLGGGVYGILNVVGDATLDIGTNDMSLNQAGWSYGSLTLICGTLTPLP